MSEAVENGRSFVSAHRDQARALGHRLADLTNDPEVFVVTLVAGLADLVDPAYTEMVRAISQGTSSELAVRGALLEDVQRPLRRSLQEGSSATALWLAQRLADAPQREVRHFALPCLRRSLSEDPERSWQLMRRMVSRAGDWIEVDSLADVWARGVLAEPFRWAELEQLVYSRRTYERRLVGATLATIAHRFPAAHRTELRAGASQQAFELIRSLMGDSEVRVQKSLSWAIRAWTQVHPEAAADLLREETSLAAGHADGARAWVIRDSLSHQPAELSSTLRPRLAGIRRHRDTPSSSIAAARAARFAAVLGGGNEAVARQGGRYKRSRA